MRSSLTLKAHRLAPPRLAATLCAVVLAAGAASAQAQAPQPAPLLGFTPAAAAAERALEARFDAQLSPAAIRERLRRLAAEPNEVGSPHDKANAEWVLQLFQAWGFDAHIETFQVLYPTPKPGGETLELLEPGKPAYAARLTEPAIPGDASSAQTAWVLPAYVAYQGDGDVTAELVYVNYGMPDDYKALARLGIDVKGKIVIARYGAGWRGLKPKLAQEHGAVGCIIYSDPADDGYAVGDVYPKGGWRPEYSLQRGSVADITTYSGDPLTPGIGATANAQRLTRETAPTILKIPVLPISYHEARIFLAALAGPDVPKTWRGALPLTYHPGPGPAKVHLAVSSNWDIKPAYDVIATLKGAESPDEWVIRGNHHDGWVMGANDPLSGQSEMLEEARALGTLAKSGWKPRRTLVYASWDGEEPGLIGSTEWVEAHAEELGRKAVFYINSDSNGRGILGGQGSYSTIRFATQAAEDVIDPETGVSVAQRARAAARVAAAGAGASEELKRAGYLAAAGGELPFGALGSGSDYTPFVQHLGIASLNLEFGGENPEGGVYHSLYDDFEHYDRFGDPGYVYAVALAQTMGRIVLRAADAEVDPFAFQSLAGRVSAEIAELKSLHADARRRSQETGKLLDDHAYRLAADARQTHVDPPRPGPVPDLDFRALDTAAARLKAAASAYDAGLGQAPALDATRRARLNGLLRSVEASLTDPEGLPRRPWYRHLLYAPGVLTGYGAKTLPGVREAIEGDRWDEAQAYIGRTARVITAAATQIEAATGLLGGG
jgi:N-acetylated-alpha-linked acidic dipeptidase